VPTKPFSQYCSSPSPQDGQWAGIDQAADADRVADGELRHLAADGADVADDLVAGHAGIFRPAPFGADGVEVRMADAAPGDVDLDVLRAGRAAVDVHRLERLVGGVRAIGFDGHASILSGASRPTMASCAGA
jgi:hypothetical protein